MTIKYKGAMKLRSNSNNKALTKRLRPLLEARVFWQYPKATFISAFLYEYFCEGCLNAQK